MDVVPKPPGLVFKEFEPVWLLNVNRDFKEMKVYKFS
jgi:hypothetical protein